MTVQADIDHSTPTAFLDRVSLLLDSFDGPGRLTLAQIVRRTGLPRSSAHRMLDHLVQLRWLQREGRHYTLGLRLMELGSLAIHQDELHAAAVGPLMQLHRATGMVVHLAVLDGDDIVYREKLGGRYGGMIPTRAGARRPAAHTAVGKALLAFDGRLGATYDTIREDGIAYEREESVSGFGCIAVPVGPFGSTVAAVSLCGPVGQMSFDHRYGGHVRMTAATIWRNLDKHVAPVLQRGSSVRTMPGLHEPARTSA
ncbi:IclR family transcriptional regulator [Gordonia terrae]|uniref:IclR family transcriptional regulator n=2 Tax=Gordonia terrae TaxID=2055 RepID=A0AAD0NUK0_9ACTN|nr:IclR family transcriptional regulator [Gordonia terrae]VTR09604.1 pectin degradation repressor protein KdgR [Clostridioides difficile]ANY22215.1 IclR family transcriptional regulator [Gordonia terrae]AWO82956.1 IclR family transcriptional regulator [Gordonia terrae]VTS29849.1 Transcriptional regulator kdgR [Gordonia terrae]GAB46317.1 putative IclR family transcriptional regulator [Gordonia terrae NBRC 100016]